MGYQEFHKSKMHSIQYMPSLIQLPLSQKMTAFVKMKYLQQISVSHQIPPRIRKNHLPIRKSLYFYSKTTSGDAVDIPSNVSIVFFAVTAMQYQIQILIL